jgi:hydrogenase-4 component G
MIELAEAKPKVGTRYVEKLRARFGAAILDESWQAPDQVTLLVELNSLPDVVEYVYYGLGSWLSTVVGNDERPLNGHFSVYYVLSVEGDENGGQGNEKPYVVIRALIPPHQPEFPAVSPRVPAAVWYEREVRDMFGIQPVGMQDKRRLVLPDDWPADLHPLRKDAMDYRLH